MKLGSIYLITDKTNGKQYVGQTSRDIDTRFREHCTEKRGNSKLHKAIQEKGWQNFSVELIEEVPLEQLDEKEIYWIKKLDTKNNGYNSTDGGKQWRIRNDWKKVQVVENGLIFDSKEEMGRMISSLTSWSLGFITDSLSRIINKQNKDFLGYHLIYLPPETLHSDYDELEDWIKTLNIRYQGKHIYCYELDMEFETIAQAAKYLLDHKLYETKSKTPIQSLVTSISKNIRGKTSQIQGANQSFTFIKVPGTTKQNSTQTFKRVKIYCPELDKTFESQVEAADYFLKNNLWTGITSKTAKLRISDVVRGAFPDYKGYTFKKV